MVRKATTVAGTTSNCVIAYTPTVMMMSWITARMAASAMRHSKRNVRYTAITTKKTINAWSALLLTLSPHVGPTFLTSTCSIGMSPYFASASLTCSCLTGVRSSDWTRTESSPRMSTLASPSPNGSSTSRTSLIDAEPFDTVNCHWVPPSKSMPRFRPRTANASTEIRTSVPESTNHRQDRSMKLKWVRSW